MYYNIFTGEKASLLPAWIDANCKAFADEKQADVIRDLSERVRPR